MLTRYRYEISPARWRARVNQRRQKLGQERLRVVGELRRLEELRAELWAWVGGEPT
jgi:hypothetical protein